MRIWTKLEHLLHPLNIWCRLGGRQIRVFQFYETYIWKPIVRVLLNKRRRKP